MERMRVASTISKEAGRDEGLKIARECLLEVRDLIQGVQVSAPFGNVKYALEVFDVLPEFSAKRSRRARDRLISTDYTDYAGRQLSWRAFPQRVLLVPFLLLCNL